MERMETHALGVVSKVHDAQWSHAVFRSAARQPQPAASVGASGAPAVGTDVVAALDKNTRRMTVEDNVITAYVRAERGSANRPWSTKAELTIIRPNADQVRIAVRVNLYPADEEHMIMPIFHALKAVTRVAVRFRPAYHPPIPTKRRHW